MNIFRASPNQERNREHFSSIMRAFFDFKIALKLAPKNLVFKINIEKFPSSSTIVYKIKVRSRRLDIQVALKLQFYKSSDITFKFYSRVICVFIL
jgi:hypothetical protein